MTQVKMIYDKNIIMGFRMEGHAGFNTKGPDILCASLSTASQMTVNGILDWIGLSFEEVLIEQNSQKAILHIEIPSNLYGSTTVQQLFKSFEMYVEMLADIYEEFIKIERSYRDDNEDS
jgi:uncharacterized protein YsxB (DUF464 family)